MTLKNTYIPKLTDQGNRFYFMIVLQSKWFHHAFQGASVQIMKKKKNLFVLEFPDCHCHCYTTTGI